jgi:hypothetical protein
MSKTICPGQDTRFWRPGDIFEVECAGCGTPVEFWKDEGRRKCPKCGARIQNPKLSMGCAQWCEHAKECLGFDPKEQGDGTCERAAVDRIVDAARREVRQEPALVQATGAAVERAREALKTAGADPRVTLAAAALAPLLRSAAGPEAGLEAAKRILKEERLDPEAAERVLLLLRGEERDSAEAGLLAGIGQ